MGKTATRVMCLLLLCGLASTAAAFDPNSDPSLIGWWKFDEGTGTAASDSSGQGNNGTVSGGAAWVNGRLGGGLDLDGTDDYVGTGKSLMNNLSDFTMAGWVKARNASASRIGLWGQNDLIEAGFMSGNVECWSAAAGTVNTRWAHDSSDWHHIAYVDEGTAMKIYIDGALANSGAGVAAYSTSTFFFNIGGGGIWDGTGNWFSGQVDDVRLYKRALTASEIKQLLPPKLKAYKPIPADKSLGVMVPLLQWSKGDTAVYHDIYLGTSPNLTAADKKPRAFAPMYYHVAGFAPGVTYYWRIDEVDAKGNVYTGDVWSFQAMPLTAYLPQPVDGGENVMLTPTLSWAAGQNATSHHVYFGTDRKAVEDGTAGTDRGELEMTTLSYKIPETLKPDTSYFWRVDEASNGKVQTGSIWSFSTVVAGPTGAIRQWWSNIGAGTAITDLTSNANYPDNPTGSELVALMEGPTGWADNYGSRLFGWVYPPQSGDYTFWIASDDAGELWLSTDADSANKKLIASVATWTNSREWGKETNQRSNPVKLEAGSRYYIEALMKEGGGGDNVAVAWQGPGIAMDVLGAGGVGPTPYLPLRAYSPSPANGAVDTVQTVTLTWNAGEKALKHEVYFGDDANDVAAADTSSSLFKGSQSGTSYDAGALEWGKTYYWRVDEINAGEADSPWVGRVWKFTTANFIPVDDFEAYDDAEGTGTRIYETWTDGYTDGLSGSTVGNIDPPFAERTIVHGGIQSMPMDYDNSSSTFLSHAYREFSPVMNWTSNGVTDLSLWVRGNQAGIPAVAEVGGKMTVTGEGADIWGTADQFTFVYKTLNGDGSLVARVVNVGTGSSTWAKGGVMVRDSLEAGSASAQMCLTGGDGNGAAFQNRASTDLDMSANDSTSNTTAATVIAPPYYVKIDRAGDTIGAYMSPDGKTWTQLGVSQFIAMEAPAYIGICVTSHTAGEYRTFEFDNIKATGASGAWQTKEVGLTRNSQQPLYVVVEDSAGKKAQVVDPNAVHVTSTRWSEWKIPLTDLQGVNLAKVKKLTIGVGDTKNPAADGTGRIYIDDIRVTKPVPAQP